jgi:hypothetical protein
MPRRRVPPIYFQTLFARVSGTMGGERKRKIYDQSERRRDLKKKSAFHTLTGKEADSMTTCEASTPAAEAMEATRAFSVFAS